MTVRSDITISIAAQNRGEYAPGTMPRHVAEVTAEYIRRLADHPSMVGADSSWLMGAQELIHSLLHCLDLANVEIDAVTPAGTSARWLSPTLAGKLANLAHFNRLNRQDVRAGKVYEATALRLDGLATDPELVTWATRIYREQASMTVDWAAWKQHLIVCADCTAGDYCPAGKEILGGATGDDAPWLKNVPR